jgi:hypothetical protein
MATAPDQPRRALVPKILLGLSSFGVLVQLFYFLVDYDFEEPIRSQIKRLVDQHFLLYAAVVFPSILVFGLCVIFMLMQWARRRTEAHPPPYRVIRSVVYVACWTLLFVIALYVGAAAPVLWVVINSTGTLCVPVWSALVVFTAIALGTEFFCSHRHRAWLRPLAWGAVTGSLVLLVQCLLTGWQIEM